MQGRKPSAEEVADAGTERMDFERNSAVHYLLFYDVVPDFVERRSQFRADHLAHAQAAVDRGELVLGGALANPPEGAVILFLAESPAIANAFAAADPYVRQGLVTNWRVAHGPPWLGTRRLMSYPLWKGHREERLVPLANCVNQGINFLI